MILQTSSCLSLSPLRHTPMSGRDSGVLQGISCISYFVQWKDWLHNQFPLCLDAQFSVPLVKVNYFIAHFSWHRSSTVDPAHPCSFIWFSQICWHYEHSNIKFLLAVTNRFGACDRTWGTIWSLGQGEQSKASQCASLHGRQHSSTLCSGRYTHVPPPEPASGMQFQKPLYNSSLHLWLLCVGIKDTMEKLTHGKSWNNCLPP